MVYRVEYRRDGPSVNYPAPRFGYLFVETATGKVTSITVLIDPFYGNLYYTTTLLEGSYFKATRVFGGATNDVIAASSGSAQANEQAFLQVTGQVNRRVGVGGGKSIRIATNLQGILQLSGKDNPPSGDSVAPRTR